MSTFREAIPHLRRGGTAKRGALVLRFLTEKEALKIDPEVFRTPTRLGIYDVASMTEWRPTDKDRSADDWELV